MGRRALTVRPVNSLWPSALLGCLGREPDRERGAATLRGGLQDEVAAHRPAQLARDVQPEARALAGGPVRATFEPAEQPLAVVLGDARAVVGDGEQEVVRPGLEGDRGVD